MKNILLLFQNLPVFNVNVFNYVLYHLSLIKPLLDS